MSLGCHLKPIYKRKVGTDAPAEQVPGLASFGFCPRPDVLYFYGIDSYH